MSKSKNELEHRAVRRPHRNSMFSSMQSVFFNKGPLIIYASGWGRREVGWVNDFWAALRLGV